MAAQQTILTPSAWRTLVVPFLLVAAWLAYSLVREVGDSATFTSPNAFAIAVAKDTASGFLPGAIVATLARAITGFLIGAGAGLAIGLAIGLWRPVDRLLSPTIDSARQVALFAWIPLLSAWLGNGEAMKVSLISLGAFFPVALATAVACANVSRHYLEVGQVLELSRRQEVSKIILPAAAPAIVAGLELGLNIAWLGTIGAEYLIGTGYINGMGDGLGAYLAQAREYARMDRILIGVIALALVGLALDRLVSWSSRRVFPWHRQ
ncbi:MAG TPA: ABC transporter permease [Beijerinckiaceae bacterium]|jgi:sulfonate transport system permease protein|nr:ABC transporter permease [Beijerinckiaceae bacterium]